MASATYYTDTRYFGALATETNEQDQTTTYFYDAKARMQATMYPDGTGVYYTYDGMGNLIGVEEGSFTVSGTSYTPAAKTDGTGVYWHRGRFSVPKMTIHQRGGYGRPFLYAESRFLKTE